VSADTAVLDFTLPRSLEAHEPPEARGLARDGVRMLVAHRSPGELSHRRFRDLPSLLAPGDVLVVNTSATLPAAIDTTSGPPAMLRDRHTEADTKRAPAAVVDRRVAEAEQPALGGIVVHVSTELPDGTWVVELRRRVVDRGNEPYRSGFARQVYGLPGGGRMRLVAPYTKGRLWTARFDLSGAGAPASEASNRADAASGAFGPRDLSRLTARRRGAHAEPSGLVRYLLHFGRPIRYGYVERDWPLSAYQTVFASPVERARAGSAEMPSAARPFTEALVTRLVAAGVVFAPLTLHTGVASPEAHEKPYPERFEVPAATARLVNAARRAGARVVAVGTTAVRALESAADPSGVVHPATGWTDLVVTPERGLRAVDGLLTGFHEPHASHLAMLEAVAGRMLLERCYREALDRRYLWHEFGDSNLLLP
jgi:S-adenosylmethionine:tRNA ribosyltransferase-isomerase